MTNTETETAVSHEDPTAIDDYHNAHLAKQARASERERLIAIAAEGTYGRNLDLDTPIGRQVLDTVGRELVAPFVDALLDSDEVVVAVESSS